MSPGTEMFWRYKKKLMRPGGNRGNNTGELMMHGIMRFAEKYS